MKFTDRLISMRRPNFPVRTLPETEAIRHSLAITHHIHVVNGELPMLGSEYQVNRLPQPEWRVTFEFLCDGSV